MSAPTRDSTSMPTTNATSNRSPLAPISWACASAAGNTGTVRMPAHHAVGVVEVERVTGRAVDERGDAGRAVQIRTHDGARSGLAAQLIAQDPGQRLAAPHQRATEPVEYALACDGAGRLGNVVQGQATETVPEMVGKSHGKSFLGSLDRPQMPARAPAHPVWCRLRTPQLLLDGFPSNASDTIFSMISDVPSKIFVSRASRQ